MWLLLEYTIQNSQILCIEHKTHKNEFNQGSHPETVISLTFRVSDLNYWFLDSKLLLYNIYKTTQTFKHNLLLVPLHLLWTLPYIGNSCSEERNTYLMYFSLFTIFQESMPSSPPDIPSPPWKVVSMTSWSMAMGSKNFLFNKLKTLNDLYQIREVIIQTNQRSACLGMQLPHCSLAWTTQNKGIF